MTEQQHPIPPRELLDQWATEYWSNPENRTLGDGRSVQYSITQAARWGWEQRGADIEANMLQKARDEELEECVEWLSAISDKYGSWLHDARRPRPKSLVEEALEELQLTEGAMYSADLGCDFTATRRALERLQELEGQADD